MATWAIAATALDRIPPSVIPLRVAQTRDNSEQSLLQRAQAGDGDAFATLFQLHKNRVYAVCLRMMSHEADAEDMTQEVFLLAFRKVKHFRGDSALSTWLHRIAVNTVLMKMRGRRSQPLVSLDTPISADSPLLKAKIGKADLSLCGTVDRIVLKQAMEELPKGYRHIFNLHEVEGYLHREIAQLLQCSIGTSKSQLYKAKMEMRHLLSTKIGFHRQLAASNTANNVANPRVRARAPALSIATESPSADQIRPMS